MSYQQTSTANPAQVGQISRADWQVTLKDTDELKKLFTNQLLTLHSVLGAIINLKISRVIETLVFECGWVVQFGGPQYHAFMVEENSL